MPIAGPSNWPFTTHIRPAHPWSRPTRLSGQGEQGPKSPQQQKGPLVPRLSPFQSGQVELSKLGVPMPQDFMTDLSPVAALLFLQSCAEATLSVVTGASAADDDPKDEVNPTISEVLNGISAALAGSVHALVALEVLPPEAEEAMTAAGIMRTVK